MPVGIGSARDANVVVDQRPFKALLFQSVILQNRIVVIVDDVEPHHIKLRFLQGHDHMVTDESRAASYQDFLLLLHSRFELNFDAVPEKLYLKH